MNNAKQPPWWYLNIISQDNHLQGFFFKPSENQVTSLSLRDAFIQNGVSLQIVSAHIVASGNFSHKMVDHAVE